MIVYDQYCHQFCLLGLIVNFNLWHVQQLWLLLLQLILLEIIQFNWLY